MPRPETHWWGEGTCFKESPLDGTLLAWWGEDSQKPWLIVTDLPPSGLRPWIGGGLEDAKRGGWQWQQTRITAPQRMERLWVTITVATLWAVSVGGEAEATQPVSGLEDLSEMHIACRSGYPPFPSSFVKLLSLGHQHHLCCHHGRMPASGQ